VEGKMILKSYSVLRKVNILFILAIISLFVFPPVTTVFSSELRDEDLKFSDGKMIGARMK